MFELRALRALRAWGFRTCPKSQVAGNTDSHLQTMSSYIRAIKPLLSYMGRRYRGFLSLRSRMGPKRRKLGRTLSAASSVNPGAGADGIKVINFKLGRRRPIRTNRKATMRIARNATPINTHIMDSEQIIAQQNSGVAKWTPLFMGTLEDVRDCVVKGYNAALATQGAQQATEIVGGMPWISTGLNWEGRLHMYSYDVQVTIKNSAQFQCDLQLYECVARENIPQTTTYNSLTNILDDGWAKNYPTGSIAAAKEDSTLYMNPVWCHYFKIQKVRNVTLKAGEVLKINMTHAMPRTVNTLLMGSDPYYTALAQYTRALVIKQTGSLVHVNVTTGSVVTETVDTSGTQIDVRMVKKYRWNNLNPNYGLITTNVNAARDGATTNQRAYDPSDGNATDNTFI